MWFMIFLWFMNYLISSGIHDFHPNHIIKSTFKFGRHIFNRNTLRLPIGFLHSLQIKGCSVIGRTNCFDEKKASQRMNNSRSLCLEVPLPNFWCKYLCRLSQWDQNLFWSHICVFLQVIRHEIHVHFCQLNREVSGDCLGIVQWLFTLIELFMKIRFDCLYFSLSLKH